MSKLHKGLVCGAAGLFATGLGIGYGYSTNIEINPTDVKQCAESLEHPKPNLKRLDEACYRSGTSIVFDTVDIIEPNEDPVPIPPQRPVLISPDEYRHRVDELIERKKLDSVLQKIGSLGLGVMVGGVAYYEWAINTPERRAANQQLQQVQYQQINGEPMPDEQPQVLIDQVQGVEIIQFPQLNITEPAGS